MNKPNLILSLSALLLTLNISCSTVQKDPLAVKPLYTSDPVQFDSDDPAIWVNPADPAQSLVIGTDKDENVGSMFTTLKEKPSGKRLLKD